MIATSKRVRFTVDEYLRMDEAGVFGDRRMELIEGRIYRMHAQFNPHRWGVSKASRAFNSRFAAGKFWVVIQGTLFLGRYGAPEPDLHVFDVPEGTPDQQLPKPFMVLEVTDKTYKRDTGIKIRQYASAGIADYWIVNINERRVEVYRLPENPSRKRSGWRYASVEHFKPGEKLKLLAYPKIAIPVNELIP